MTEKDHLIGSYRWMYTDLVGTLKLTVQGEIAKIPLVTIKIYGKDSSIFEYELPLNFQYDDISGPFLAIKGLNEHYFGFHFNTTEDKLVLA